MTLLQVTLVPVFLFSDIEGSTARWESNAEAMSAALHRHDEAIAESMRAYRGRVFKALGDAFCVVFESAADAIAAAVDAQRRLRYQDWSPVGGLHVRMAVHAGDAMERQGDYFGPAVNRVARLLAAAHGGQIVVSGSAAAQFGHAAGTDISLRALGTFRLKDLEAPEQIYQAVAGDLPVDFKPLNTLDAIPNNLPIQSSAFVGRSDDIAEIRTLLRQARLLTVAGPGGVGKTRIALQCAADRMDRMTGGVWFVNLAPLTDPSLVAGTMLSAMGASGTREPDALRALVDYVQNRTMLIVLDNCEHVLGEAARCVAAIHERSPHVTIVATSREALHVDGEQIYRLAPLAGADAVALFIARARAVSSAFEVTASNRTAIEAICARLDGIPLAIELAAARTVALSPQQLIERLDRRFRLLTSGARTALPRQQTLEALIDWSHDLLTQSEKVLFARLSVFRGSFTLEAATAVCADDAIDEYAILDLLTSLTDKSLVAADVQGERPRYHLLESIREYATGKLHAARESERLRLCHAEYFVQRARIAYAQFDTQPAPGWLDDLRPDLDNFRAALDWSTSAESTHVLGAELAANIAPLFLRLSLLGEGIERCRRALAVDSGAPSDSRARLRYVMSMLYNNQGRYAEAKASASEAVALYRTGPDQRGLVRALSQLAHFGSHDVIDEAVALARSLSDPRLTAGVLRRCAFALPPAEIEAARAQFREALDAAHGLTDRGEECLVRQWWAEAEASAGEYARAIDLSVEAMTCADDDTRMYLANNIAGYAYAADDADLAKPYALQAFLLAERDGHELLTALALAYLAPAAASANREEAVRLFGFARAQLDRMQWSGYPSDRVAFENLERRLRAAAEDRYDAAFLAGKNLTRDEAMAFARRFSTSERPSSAAPSGS